MHHIKSDARREAYADPRNPFSRYRPKRTSSASRFEGRVVPHHEEVVLERFDSPLALSSENLGTQGDSSGSNHSTFISPSLHPPPASAIKKATPEKGRRHGIRVLFGQQQGDIESGKTKLPHFTAWGQFRATILGTWINVLLVFIPTGIALNYADIRPSACFAVNFIALLPSMAMISYAVEEIMLRVGEILGALLSITFSNATQLISSILLLKSRQITILKIALLGSVISNLLFMPGLSFLVGGYNRYEQKFNVRLVQTISMMLLLAIFSILVPTASRFIETDRGSHNVTLLSRGTSIIVLISYAMYLLFQLKTHKAMFVFTEEHSQTRFNEEQKARWRKTVGVMKLQSLTRKTADRNLSVTPPRTPSEEEEGEEPEPQLSLPVAVFTLIVSTVFIALNAEFATNSIQSMVQSANISPTFVGFVILPILANDPDCILQAKKDNMYRSLALTLEKCMQTALMVMPLLVILAWCMSIDEMTLDFDGFSVIALCASVLIVTYVVQDGRSNWFIGALLIKIYIIVALAAYFIH